MENSVAIHAMKEELTYLDQMFPISEFVDHFDAFADRSFPSHWHHEFELQIILKGSVEYIVNGTSYVVGEGCAIYIAPEAVHMMTALSEGTVGYNIVLSPQFLINLMRSANCEKYTVSLTSRRPEGVVITPERKEGHTILELLKRMYYTESTHVTYELFLLENLIGIWRNLLAILPKHLSDSEDNSNFLREQRMKDMLNYIRQNYSQPMTIPEICAAANLSKSECFRCFSELSKMTPIEYVNQFRLFQASQLLLTTDKSISDICYSTGFNNTSYFSKKFKEQYRISPKAYRSKSQI
ncbi:AraC family transcriptional regulator [Butyricicoccus sp. Marseille-Q5471]|uniref:AraC family transcriptional regulator n=1 Tax=Butyricicoccus sp. Marseille-Q5471 TaxID=3039493 RepID=UPI0024BCE1A0|nr:AraC family transcriptional regulator [Butyricicoccus sp. Marseille-Q5471]